MSKSISLDRHFLLRGPGGIVIATIDFLIRANAHIIHSPLFQAFDRFLYSFRTGNYYFFYRCRISLRIVLQLITCYSADLFPADSHLPFTSCQFQSGHSIWEDLKTYTFCSGVFPLAVYGDCRCSYLLVVTISNSIVGALFQGFLFSTTFTVGFKAFPV